jgi:DNA-binding XRE family transcriptional regulator
MVSRVKEIREKRGYSQSKAAAVADVAPNTWRLYEANPQALSEKKRARCDAALSSMASSVRGSSDEV